jgi:glycosyltransferase involved in cell wall biosynthesis
MACIDVLIPVHNRPEFLPAAVASILGQTMADFRLVIYDDGSTCTYDLPADPRIVFVRGEKNLGVAGARNALLDLIRSPLACWQDSDDVSHPQRLEKLVAFMDANPAADMAISWMFFFQHPSPPTCTRTVYRVDPAKRQDPRGFHNNFAFATTIFRRELRDRFRFDPQWRDGGEDIRWVRPMVEAGCQFGLIPQSLYYCRRHPGRLTTQRQERAARRAARSAG